MPFSTIDILLLDDDPEFHEIFREYLDLAQNKDGPKFVFHGATTENVALDILRTVSISAAFVDYRLGPISGIDFVRDCRVEGLRVPFIILTGYDSQQTIAEAVAAGAFDYASKDEITPVMLSRSIHRARAAKERNDELRAALQQAQSAAGERAAFLSNMSHELRTPLNGVLGFSELLSYDQECNPERVHEYAKNIRESGIRLLELLNNLLVLAQSQSEVPTNPVPFELCGFLQQTCQQFATVAHARSISFELRLPPPPIHITYDAKLLRMAIRPILDNAVKFTEASGHVTVTVECGKSLTVKIADTGCGMSPVTIENAVAPFYQYDLSLSRKHEGAGIGLSIASLSVSALKGQVGIASELGKGTTVTIEFPIPERMRVAC